MAALRAAAGAGRPGPAGAKRLPKSRPPRPYLPFAQNRRVPLSKTAFIIQIVLSK